ncbi:hypothetical protein [Roseibacillus ishigakijimensis]|uniref:hypothetical protein n=1 Tax=Roseibacillus ishigakijimensis TaxID=454146 RepID=UPI0019058E56|nr:hypothetical protein [Roseibacillus ishigakijimensis]
MPKPIRHRIFYGRSQGGLRLIGGKVVTERIQDAHRQAEEWLNEHPSLELVSISSAFGNQSDISAAFVTVWYRGG